MSLLMWIGWALLCIAQNFAFTFVSRARNSGSLKKHMVAGLFSNGIWFVGQLFAVSAFMSILSGHFGLGLAILAGVYYTVFTLVGSISAHKYALITEKGNSRVGAHKDVATFTSEEGDMIRKRALIADTGDGIGTFTLQEISQLKDLAAAQKQVVDELVMSSSEWQPSPSIKGPVEYVAPTGGVSTLTLLPEPLPVVPALAFDADMNPVINGVTDAPAK